MSLRRAQQEIDSREFAEWVALYTLEPFGPERLDLAAARIAATVAAGASGKSQRLQDHMPDFGSAPMRQSKQQVRNAIQGWAMTHELMDGNSNGRNC